MSTPYCNYFSATLRAARKDRSQAEFARFLGLPNQQRLDRYERGINLPDVQTAYNIALRLGVTLDQMMTDPSCMDKGTAGVPDATRMGELLKTAKFDDVKVVFDRLLSFHEPGQLMKIMQSLTSDQSITGSARVLLLTYLLEDRLNEIGKLKKGD